MYLAYIKYVLRHKWFVFVEACKLGIPWRGLVHDLSKFRLRELVPYTNYFYGDGHDDFKRAWLEHIHSNPHHWQYWVLNMDDEQTILLPVPKKYLKEMLADWIGVGRALKTKGVLDWYAKNRCVVKLHEDARKWIEEQIGFENNETAEVVGSWK